jgi:polar amino acid transport system substrate-binding protein
MHWRTNSNANMNRRELLIALSLPGACVVNSVQAEVGTFVRVAYFEDYAPMSFKKPNGDMTGIFVETLDLISVPSGMAFSHQGFPWVRAQKNIKDDRMDALCTLPTPEREEYLTFTTQPIVENTMGVYHRPDDARIKSIKSVQNMHGLIQGNYLGNGFAKQYLEPDLIKWQSNISSVLRLVAAEALDVFVESELIGKDVIRKYALAGKLAFTPLPFLQPVKSYFGLRKSFANMDHVLASVDTALEAARKSGALAKIYKKYV